MSRLIVKNLPSYVTPAKLREHFEQKKGPGGTLTDVKVSSKPDGTSRRFGFVGYKSDHEALAAQQWFNRTFIDSTRISVDVTEVRTCIKKNLSQLFLMRTIIGSKRCAYATTQQTTTYRRIVIGYTNLTNRTNIYYSANSLNRRNHTKKRCSAGRIHESNEAEDRSSLGE